MTIKKVVNSVKYELEQLTTVGTVGVAFGSSSAVSCSNSLKKSISNNTLDIRFGINSGDVHFENNDVFGDTVNIAARLEAVSSSNEITVSESVYQSLEKDIKNFKTIY